MEISCMLCSFKTKRAKSMTKHLEAEHPDTKSVKLNDYLSGKLNGVGEK